MPDDNDELLNQAMEEALQSVLLREEGPKPESNSAHSPHSPEQGSSSSPSSTDSPEENSELKDQLIRLAADFENFRKRAKREQEEARQFGIEKLLLDLLPALDNLERALYHSQDESSPLTQGFLMVAKQFKAILRSYGVESFESKNQAFNPVKHEAIGHSPSDKVPLGYVAEEVEKGYFLHNRLIRPAKVLVASAPSTDDKKSS